MPFYPRSPSSFEEAGLNAAIVESLVLKFLVNSGMASGRRIATELGLPFGPFPEFLRQLKNQQIVTYANSASANDYVYSLTDAGRARARIYFEECAYVGTAPVPFDDYLESVSAQTITTEHPKEDDLREAFSDLLDLGGDLPPARPGDQLGPRPVPLRLPGQRQDEHRRADHALLRHDGLDSPGDSTSRARSSSCSTWPTTSRSRSSARRGLLDESDFDRRWIQIKRPTIVAGGELRMEDLEIHFDPVTKVSEAPLQLKSNLGTFLIDDFGRQRMQPIELLNRWIVPLEKRYDFLSLANGKKIRVPFDQLIIFSTNLEPKQLVDEAFLRRIPVQDPGDRPDRGRFRQMIDDLRPQARLRATVDRDGRRLPDRSSTTSGPAARSAAASRATSCSRSATTASTTTSRSS